MSEQENAELQNQQPAGEGATPAPQEGAKAKAEKKAESVPKVKFFPVKLLKNYRPLGVFKVNDGGEMRDPTGDEIAKVAAGAKVLLPIDEAKAIIDKKIAERNDAIA